MATANWNESTQQLRGYGDEQTRLARAQEYLQGLSKTKGGDNKKIAAEQELQDIRAQLETKSQMHHKDTRNSSQRLLSTNKSGKSILLTKSNLLNLNELGDDLTIPDNISQLLEGVPEELHEYIIEEIIADLFLLEQYQDGKSKVERAQSYRDKLVSAIQKKKTEVASSNLYTIKKARMSTLTKKEQLRVA